MKKIYYFISCIVALSLTVSCEKILEFDPEGSNLEEDEVLSTKEGVESLLNSAYGSVPGYLGGSFQVFSDLMADDLQQPTDNTDFDQIYRHNVLFFNSTVGNTYGAPYASIFKVNRVLEVVNNFDFSLVEANRIKGECYFLRALGHFEVVKIFAHTYGYSNDNTHPGIAVKDVSTNELIGRSSVEEVYQFIINDLTEAISLLPVSNSIYATQDAARALLAKVYFQQGNYNEAAQAASEVINSGRYSLGSSVDRHLINDVPSEAIWWLDSYLDIDAGINFNASAALNGNYRAINGNAQLKPTRDFYNIYAADTSDQRLDFFVIAKEGEPDETVVCTKFDKQNFNVAILHLTDLKLLRAEALAEAGLDLATAVQDVNDVRERAYGGPSRNLSAGASATAIIEAARYERRIEMFGEGDRFTQLKRMGAIEGENISVRGDAWDCNGMILQFPISEKTDLFELNPTGGCN